MDHSSRHEPETGTYEAFAADEPTLADIAVMLWEGKWTIILATLAGLLVGVGLAIGVGNMNRAQLPLFVAPEVVDGALEELNRELDFEPVPVDAGLVQTSALFQPATNWQVTPQLLLSTLVAELQAPAVVGPALQGSGLVDPDVGEGALAAASAEIIATMYFTTPDGGGTPGQPWRMSYLADGAPSALRTFAAVAVEQASARVSQVIGELIEEAVADRERAGADAIADLRARRDLVVERYRATLEQNLAVLREQARIARRLGIEDPIAGRTGEAGGNGPGPMVVIAGDAPAYLRGYRALEAEISVISLRGRTEPFIAELRVIDAAIARVEGDRATERAIAGFQGSLLADEAAAFIAFEPAMVEVSPRFPMPIVVAFGLLLGAGAGVVIVAAASALRNRRR